MGLELSAERGAAAGCGDQVPTAGATVTVIAIGSRRGGAVRCGARREELPRWGFCIQMIFYSRMLTLSTQVLHFPRGFLCRPLKLLECGGAECELTPPHGSWLSLKGTGVWLGP